MSGLILAGGLGRRMGRAEKGLQLLRGRPMIEWVIERFQPQVRELLVSANDQLPAYRRYGLPVLEDGFREPDGSLAGPLAGLHAGMSACAHPLIATAPCDTPFLPLDLVERLHAALAAGEADVAVASIGGRAQPVFVLAKREVLPRLDAYLRGGGRKAEGWYAGLRSVAVAFDEEAAAFANINTLDELRGSESAGQQ